jgi:hypothetical protein
LLKNGQLSPQGIKYFVYSKSCASAMICGGVMPPGGSSTRPTISDCTTYSPYLGIHLKGAVDRLH